MFISLSHLSMIEKVNLIKYNFGSPEPFYELKVIIYKLSLTKKLS